ncbi:MAG: farnesyl-diphosphate synthase [Azospirillum brasilense]|nr:MAG: farnesyl-diphosphate synthase [Azospirillum brasilense]
MTTNLQNALASVSEKLDAVMNDLLPSPLTLSTKVISFNSRQEEAEVAPAPSGEAKVMEAMRYSALGGGKRLRPFLTVESAKLFGVNPDAAMMTAAAMEFVHVYSLIHDDLPAMDNDDFRRGKPSNHKQFGEAAAILAGDALLTYAFEVLANPKVHADANVRCELIRSVARAAGVRGMVGGQMMDLDAEHKELSVEEVIRLQRLKTGEMFAVSCEAGAILGKAPEQLRARLQRYAHDIGLAFQITDDLLDVEGTRTETGKGTQKDAAAGKATLVSALGVERAREQANTLAAQALDHLSAFDERATALRELAKFVVTRKN